MKVWGLLEGFKGGFWGKFLRFWVCPPFYGIPLQFGVIWGDLKGDFGLNFSGFGSVVRFLAFR